MSERLSEQDLDLIVYVMDVWMQSNDTHPALDRVEALAFKIANCTEARLKA